MRSGTAGMATACRSAAGTLHEVAAQPFFVFVRVIAIPGRFGNPNALPFSPATPIDRRRPSRSSPPRDSPAASRLRCPEMTAVEHESFLRRTQIQKAEAEMKENVTKAFEEVLDTVSAAATEK